MVEFHPIMDILLGFSYFHKSEGDIETEGTYTENSGDFKTTYMTWSHPISDVVSSLIKAGIKIESLNQFPYSPYNCFEGLEKRGKNRYFLAHLGQNVPLVYSIKGIK